MTCTITSRFVILGQHVGWPLTDTGPLDPPGADDVLSLHAIGTIELRDLDRFMLPPRLARGCGPCAWYLVVPGRPSRILVRDVCISEPWADGTGRLVRGQALRHPVAIAHHGDRLAVLDIGAGGVFVWRLPEGQLGGWIPTPAVGPIAFTAAGLVVIANGAQLRWFTPTGDPVAAHRLPRGHIVLRMVASHDGALWVAARDVNGVIVVRRVTIDAPVAGPSDETTACAPAASCCPKPVFTDAPSSAEAMSAAVPSHDVRGGDCGFCLGAPAADGTRTVRCFRWDGGPIDEGDVLCATGAMPAPVSATVKTGAIDSGIPRCRWHRVRLDADVPTGSRITVETATTEDPEADPHPDDWTVAPNDASDFLIDQPPGRYLILRITLSGSAIVTPILRRLRLDFPRATSLDRLPAVYRDDPVAEAFTERFLSLFDTDIEDLDRAIERFPALLDSAGAPGEVLPWLGAFLGVAFDVAWDESRRRRILQAVPELYRRRGTREGLALAIELLFDVRPAIEERFDSRASAQLGRDTRLRDTRLFGKSTSRFRLDRSPLGRVALRSYGDPALDPFLTTAHRFTVMMPPTEQLQRLGTETLERLIENQKPAHTVHTLRLGGAGFIVGRQAIVGVDTVLGLPEPPVLANAADPESGTARLRRTAILRPGPHRVSRGPRVGASTVVGIGTTVE